MSQPGDAAEQVVSMAANVTMKGAEVVGNLAGKGFLSLANFLIAAARSQTRTRGKTRMQSFNGKPTKVFVIKKGDLKTFAKKATEYGVLYAAIVNRKDKSDDSLCDVVVNASDAAKVNRISNRFALSTVDVESIREEILKSREQKKEASLETDAQMERQSPPAEKTYSVEDELLDEMMPEQQNPNVQSEEMQNPTMAGMEKKEKSPSAPMSDHKNSTEKDIEPGYHDGARERVPVRKLIRDMKEERRTQALRRQAQPALGKVRQTKHNHVPRKRASQKTKGR